MQPIAAEQLTRSGTPSYSFLPRPQHSAPDEAITHNEASLHVARHLHQATAERNHYGPALFFFPTRSSLRNVNDPKRPPSARSCRHRPHTDLSELSERTLSRSLQMPLVAGSLGAREGPTRVGSYSFLGRS